MTEQLMQLNDGQSVIFTRSNIRRTFPDFDETDISGLYRSGSDLVVLRNDGSQQSLPADQIIKTFKDYTSRLPDFFSYLGPNYRGPSIWRNNCYVILKGWNYQKQGTTNLINAKAQNRWVDKFVCLDSEEKLIALLNQFDLGYLISPDGKSLGRTDFSIGFDTDGEKESTPEPQPFCSCGSYKRQQSVLPEIQQEIPGYQPTCKHMTWFKKYRELLVKRSQLIESCRGHVASNATAWYYAPPNVGEQHGKFAVIYTKQGQMAPLNKWRYYRPEETFNQHDAWGLFDSMIEKGFVPFPSTALPSISHAFKNV